MMEICFLFANGVEKSAEKEPISMELKRDDLPADRFTVRYLLKQPLFDEEAWGVRVRYNGDPVFFGIVDEHETAQEAGVYRECFVCRSLAALLTDSEAMPGVLQMPSVRLMEKLYLAPFGLSARGAVLSPQRGQMTVERGETCWDVLCDFSETFLKCTPHVERDGTVCFAERAYGALSLRDVKKSVVTRRPKEKISRVVVQSSVSGAYNTVFERPDAPLRRVRYLHAQADTPPAEIFAEAERAALQVKLVCSGYLDAQPGDRTDFFIPGVGCRPMALSALHFFGEAGAYNTELILEEVEHGLE